MTASLIDKQRIEMIFSAGRGTGFAGPQAPPPCKGGGCHTQ
ncbi:hypothetical protein [Polaromonas sp. CG9_12]|nr:hypothetical protein [Polaromonas sp. CG9_12]